MANEKIPTDLRNIIFEAVYRKYSKRGVTIILVLSTFLLGVFLILWNWDKILTLPGVNYITRWRIPPADPKRFSVMIAHLENDENHVNERLIKEALIEFKGIEVLVLDQTISLEGPKPEEMIRKGHESALKYLKQSGASAMIWGTVLGSGDRTTFKLHWTSSQIGMKEPGRYAFLIDQQYQLPQLFWKDLAEVLKLLVASQSAGFYAQEGHYVADQLSPFITRIQNLLEASTNRPEWDINARVTTQFIMAKALYLLGKQSGNNKPLEEAIALYREALKEFTREKVPLLWAMTQNNLGVALRTLGERESGTVRLEEAVNAYRDALKERTREKVPLQWAMTQSNLGATLGCLGQRENGTTRLEEAVSAFQEALKEHTKDKVPLQWAATQNNLGLALVCLGEMENDTTRLEKAVSAFQEVLKKYTRDKVPLQWAATQNNLGITLLRLGEKENNTALLEEAVNAYRDALKEYAKEKVPLLWAITQNNIGSALHSLGQRENGTTRLEEAVNAYREALKVFQDATATYYIEGTRANLQRAESLLQERRK